VIDENGDLLADSQNVLNKLLNVHRIVNVRQIETQTAYPLITDPNTFVVEKAIGNLKIDRYAGNDQIPSELIQAEGKKLWPEIHKLINCIWNKEQ
jgi:hypothetical protein